MQPRIQLAFWAASTCCWVMYSFSSTSAPLRSEIPDHGSYLFGLYLNTFSLTSLIQPLSRPDAFPLHSWVNPTGNLAHSFNWSQAAEGVQLPSLKSHEIPARSWRASPQCSWRQRPHASGLLARRRC